MDRRTFLATASGSTALVAGCLKLAGDSQRSSNETGSAGHEPGSVPADRDVASPLEDVPTVVDFETAPLSAAVVGGRFSTADGLRLEIDLAAPATNDSPARLTAVIENGRPFAQTFRPRRLVVLDDPPLSRDDEGGIVYLVPTADHDLVETAPAVDRDADGRWRVASVRDEWFPETITLEGEQRLALEYSLVGHHDRDEPPIGSGTYRFSRRGDGFSIAIWPTDEPGPTAPSRFADAAVPSIPDSETAWYHDAGPTTEVSLRPDVESVTAPGAVEFDLVNRAREPMVGNPYRWRLYKLVDGKWFPVEPWGWPLPAGSITPGEIDETELHLYHGEPIPVDGVRTVGHLGGGRYAYTVGYSLDDETHAAMLDLEAPTLSIAPESEASVEREGETIVVRLPNHDDARRPATFTVTRTDGADGDKRLIEEQLSRRPFRAFRNTLPFFENGVTEVRLQTDRSTALGPVGYDDGGTRTVTYGGTAFEATGRVLEQP
ncbi:hypothetical protein [Halopiger djelfimassiliensis]|uniref:hypothetical protein n=1 Tax=Halopiger djelfimassiliensis TaxID=1293047 RepID=UPI0009DC0647|nr:hypothetical protein [Halopiger djelfimassiliensis]